MSAGEGEVVFAVVEIRKLHFQNSFNCCELKSREIYTLWQVIDNFGETC